ncbi:protein of unknown function DUF58 [Gluconacetobacter diazotrophicus PA1 5]|nr:DUF58 domain-containing protein [Gluconacetobacter diazotrophicus]ACI52742.1 protein of unknown function DUF58 [Gluconacetobacter diazotrophicus PA1 5]TWB06134.1 uncharacterized protein DUF58 [Gluconacetobacter diazotrophicus]
MTRSSPSLPDHGPDDRPGRAARLLRRLLRRPPPNGRATAGGDAALDTPGAAVPLPLAAETLAARMPALILAAQRIAATVAVGHHGRRQSGPGEDFWQFRPAQPGEPVTRIDWRQSARSLRAYVRETEAEAAQTLCLWCDPSASMRWRSGAALPLKSDRAVLLALAVGTLALRQGERVRVLAPDGPIDIPPGGRAALDRLAVALLRIMEGGPDNPGLPNPHQVPRHARVVLLGDGLGEIAPLDALLRGLAARPARAHLLLVNDPAEASLPYAGRVRFAGLEDEAAMTLSGVEGLRAAYRDAYARHQDDLASVCRATGLDLIRHVTDQRPETALLALHAALMDRGGAAGRAARGGRGR